MVILLYILHKNKLMNLKLLIPTNNTISDNVSIIEHENKITQEELLLTIDAIDALIKHFKGSLSYNSPYVHYIKNVLITLSDWICTLGEYIIRINEGNKFETINYNITIISRLHLLEPQNKIITLQALKEIITNVDKLKQILLNIQNISPYQDKPSFNFHDIIKTHIHIELLLLEYELCISSLINTPQLAIKFALEFIKFANNRQLKSAAYLKIFFYMQDKLTSDASNLVLPNDGFYPIINQVFKEIQHDNSLVTILTELLYNATRYVTMKVFENKGLDKFVQDYTSYLSIYYHTNSSICHIMAGIYNIKIDTCIVNIFQREITNNDLKRIVNTAYDTFATITNNHWSYLNMESFKEAIDIYNILQEYQDQLTQNISQNEITEIKFLYLDKLNNHFTDDKYKDILYVINKQYIYMKQNIFYNNINNIFLENVINVNALYCQIRNIVTFIVKILQRLVILFF